MEILLLRNYYSSLTFSAIGDSNITEEVTPELSPRYSRTTNGSYGLVDFPSTFINTRTPFVFYYGSSLSLSVRTIGFGNNDTPVSFYDYIPQGTATTLVSTRKSYSTIYDQNTKTYTITELYVITNTSSNDLIINEIMIGSGDNIYITRDLLGENSFTLNGNESVNFEITIKYTIAEPLK